MNRPQMVPSSVDAVLMTRESFHPPRSRSAALLRNVVAAAPIQIFARPAVRCLRHRCRRRHPIERRLCSDSAADQLPSFIETTITRDTSLVNTASTRETTKTPLSLILEPERKIQPLS